MGGVKSRSKDSLIKRRPPSIDQASATLLTDHQQQSSTSREQRANSPYNTQLPDMNTSQPKMPPQELATKFAYLMTPEEQTAHSFSQEQHEETHPKLAPIHGLQSPPSSPTTHTLPNIASATGYPAAASPQSPQYSQQNNYQTGFGSTSPPAHSAPRFGDAALFPLEVERAQPQSPLFSHEQRQPSASPRATSIDRRPETVGFSLNYPFSLGIRTPKQAEEYWLSCCGDADKMRHLPEPTTTIASSTRDPISVSQLRSIERSNAAKLRLTVARSNRIVKPSAPPTASERRHVRRASRQQKPAHHAAASPPSLATPPPRQPAAVRHHARSSPDDSPANNTLTINNKAAAKHRRAPASKPRPVGESWADVPDFCPPLSSLSSALKPLKARPVGSSGPLDLSKDPDRHHLHPDELQVASVLRLQCAKYLLNKRKIFKAKVEHLRNSTGAGDVTGSPGGHYHHQGNFNKTEAQKACTIDVNKASSLFQAFEDVGWMRREWFERFLD